MIVCKPNNCKHIDLFACLAQWSELQGDCFVYMRQPASRYPRIQANGYSETVHNAAFLHVYQEIPDGLQVNHRCNIKRCWNPNHLYAGTQGENMQDQLVFDPTWMSRIHLSARKFSDETVKLIKVCYAQGIAQKEIARVLECDPSYVSHVVHGRLRF